MTFLPSPQHKQGIELPHTHQVLLAQFVGQFNEAAFRTLMDRYGAMVLRICKRILGNDHDAEDAYRPSSSS